VVSPGHQGLTIHMANETRQLAEFAADLELKDIPENIKQRARDSIADTIATMIFGHDFPWSQMIINYAHKMGSGGKSFIMGNGEKPVHAPYGALANGALAHAFELDGALRPSCGAHPGATILSSTLALSQERQLSGNDLLTAFITGTEVMVRIGRATKHSNETRGFHAPGTTGTFGAAVGCGKLLDFDSTQIVNAMGVAGSLSSGLVEFSRSGTGAMVKRLHMGRAAEGGILAANLAESGFTGPETILEGECGFLKVFCNEWDMDELTKGLGTSWVSSRLSMKRFACHTAAHTPVQAILDLRQNENLHASDIDSITIETGEKELRRHVIYDPADVMMAQYSVPFCVALALVYDPTDPRTFRDVDVKDKQINELINRIKLVPWSTSTRPTPIASNTIIRTKDGRTLSIMVDDFKGTPDTPLSDTDLREKFLMLTKDYDASLMSQLFERLQSIENEQTLDWLHT
jgi:2-methylcitrate dehydratase PrpD